MASRKVDFALAMREAATELSEAATKLAELEQVYFDSAYNSGGADEIVDGDIGGHDITAAQLASLVTLAQNLALFLNDDTPAQADYDATLNAVISLS